MKILVINSGSSSLKFQLFKFPGEEVIASGLIERIGETESAIRLKAVNHDAQLHIADQIPNHKAALEQLAHLLLDGQQPIIDNPNDIHAVGHRVVHGGEKFSTPMVIDHPDLINELKKLSVLAPLHNPSNIIGLEVASEVFPSAMQVAVFDTAFHQTLPEHAYRYAIPNGLYRNHGFRAYGFHGTSHQYVSRAAAHHLGIDQKAFNGITVHLGNGCSMTAIKNGQSIDTSMGLTPMGGLMMGSRPGDFDPSLILFLGDQLKMSFSEIDTLLNKQSGLKGLTGVNDLREIVSRYEKGDLEAQLAIHMYVYRIRKYIGAYAVAVGRLDAIIFTAGVGENSAFIREKVCADLDILGVKLDRDKNKNVTDKISEFQTSQSQVKLLVVPTNEELEIALQAEKLVNN